MTRKQSTQDRVQVASRERVKVRRRSAAEVEELDPMEEKVARARAGVTLEDSAPLTMMDELPGLPAEVVAQIRAIERRALQLRGQVRPLTAKQKIISALKRSSDRGE